jgi:hypothetical protein
MLILAAIAATFALQAAEPPANAAEAPVPVDETVTTPAPPPTDAATLIAEFDTAYELYPHAADLAHLAHRSRAGGA